MGKNKMSEQNFVSYNAIFSDGHFEREVLGELINKGGAAGKIYKSVTHPKLVAKIFHEKGKSQTNRRKLEAMLLNPPNIPHIQSDGREFVQIAWPEAILEDDEGFCVGYLMPFINTEEAVSLDHLMQKAVRQKVGLSERYTDRLDAASNVATMVAALHKCGHYIVDLKPSNVFVYKEKMIIAMFDCDGFSINGNSHRYPAEFVSEEYIYPEGMSQSCEEMGQEQDKFALAVILFKLLNNGIHPFSGTPRKQNSEMLSIQERIAKYNYAYGLWPDSYQSPHPYSMHEYFDAKTLKLFDRAFLKDQNRPTAKEWVEHIEELYKQIKICKQDQNHVYFTSKGCGLCAVAEKIKQRLKEEKNKSQMPVKIRGLEISELSDEKNKELKKQKHREFIKINKLTLLGIGLYFVFFSSLYFILRPFKDVITSCGHFVQLFAITGIGFGIYSAGNFLSQKLPLLKNDVLVNMLRVYAFINLLFAYLLLNGISLSFFALIK